MLYLEFALDDIENFGKHLQDNNVHEAFVSLHKPVSNEQRILRKVTFSARVADYITFCTTGIQYKASSEIEEIPTQVNEKIAVFEERLKPYGVEVKRGRWTVEMPPALSGEMSSYLL